MKVTVNFSFKTCVRWRRGGRTFTRHISYRLFFWNTWHPLPAPPLLTSASLLSCCSAATLRLKPPAPPPCCHRQAATTWCQPARRLGSPAKTWSAHFQHISNKYRSITGFVFGNILRLIYIFLPLAFACRCSLPLLGTQPLKRCYKSAFSHRRPLPANIEFSPFTQDVIKCCNLPP